MLRGIPSLTETQKQGIIKRVPTKASAQLI